MLRAQLLEEGLDVEAHEAVASALETLESSPALPALLIADLSGSDDPATDLDILAGWSKQVPIWILASRSLIVEKNLKGRGFEMILLRPVDMSELVEQIKRRLEA